MRKDEISEITQHFKTDAGADQQVRHLKRDGWHIGDDSGIHQLDPFKVSHEFATSSTRKRAVISAKNFDDIKKAFDNCCASCGAKEGESSPRYGKVKILLQKGHRDPSGDGHDPSNIIPQCQYCNQAYQDDFVFDEKGRVHSIASVEPVKRSKIHVQKNTLNWLKDNIDND